jgi:hypothetical protein
MALEEIGGLSNKQLHQFKMSMRSDNEYFVKDPEY